ncbi:hypothetical protein Leryth_003013 [Lithospermum erythrorhizon]|nr:hypothetical protein Leryth_003013 [Lithospermum erythrorhizon]
MSSPATTTAAGDHPQPPPQPITIDHQTHSPKSHSNSPPQSPPSTTASPPQPPPPTIPLFELKNLSSALSSFQDSFKDFHLHLNSLKNSVDNLIAKNPSQNSKNSVLPQSRSNFYGGTGVSTTFGDDPSDDIVGKVSTEGVEAKIDSDQELKTLCEAMDFRGLKRYLVMNLRDIDTLRLEVPKALKLAPNPAKLVLECSGRFFLQGSKAYVKGSPMVTGREASVFILECFILMEGGENEGGIDAEVKEEADRAVSLWRKRMISEGGIMQAWRIDARGLLLLLGGYGVPPSFKNDDLRDLIRNSNVREMAGTLRRSSALMAKVPEIIEEMIKNKQEVDAIDVAYTFGFEERFDFQTVLTSMLQKFKELPNKGKKSSQALPSAVNEANKKQLVVLKSLVKCLECHKIDSSKIIPGWQVQENISSLEKDITEYNKNIGAERAQKRRSEEAVARRRAKFHEGKRARHTGQWMQQPKVGHNSRRHLLDSGHINGYSASQSMLHPQVAETGYAAAGAYGGMVVDQSGHVINHGVQPYGWHTDPTLTERAVTHSYAAQPSASTMSSLYRPPPSSLEGYVMLLSGSSIAVPNRGPTTDLYQFADTVVDNEYHPPGVPSNPTSYPY